MNILLDMSVFWYQAMWSMKSASRANDTHIEAEQFAINLYLKMVYLISRFKGQNIIMGLDSKEWRSPWFENYIKTHYRFWRSKSEAKYVIDICGKQIIAEKDETKGWVQRAIKKAEATILDLDDQTKWVGFEQDGSTPEWFIEECNGQVFKNLYTECPEWEHVYGLIKYKGKRRDKWDESFVTPYSKFKDMARKLTMSLSAHFGIPTVAAEWAEFDDIAHALVSESPATSTIICSTDKDMDQEMLNGLFVTRFDPSNLSYVRKEKRVEEIHMFAKLIGGDKSDNLGPVTVKFMQGKVEKEKRFGEITWDGPDNIEQVALNDKGKKKATGLTNAKWLIEKYDELGANDLHKWLIEHQMYDSYTCNYTMMHLAMCPESIKTACKNALKNLSYGESKYGEDDFLVGIESKDSRESRIIENQEMGRVDRNRDMAEGWQE